MNHGLILASILIISGISNMAYGQTTPISLSMQKDMYYPNDVVVINGTSASNQLVTIEIKNPFDKSVFEKSLLPSAKGTFSITYVVDSYPTKGTYVVIATQNSDTSASYFGVYTKPAIRLEATMDKINYENYDTANITILDLAESVIDIKVLDNSQVQKFEDKISTTQDGHTVYPLNITSYPVGVYSVLVTSSTGQVKLGFSVGLMPIGGQISVNTEKSIYSLGDDIVILGTVNANSLVEVSLVDPNGTSVYSGKVFSDNTGHFTISDLRIPTNAAPGNWQIVASSGVNHQSLYIQVVRSIYGVNGNPTLSIYGPGGPAIPIRIDTPLKQFKSGIAAKDVKCKEGLQFIMKNENGQPACVTVHTFDELITRGWGIIPLGGLPTSNNAPSYISIGIFYNGTMVSYNDNTINLKQGQNATLMLNVTSDRANAPVTLYTAPHSGFTKTNGIDFKLSDTAVTTPAKVMLYMSVSKDATPSTYGATVKGNNTNSGSATYLFFVTVK